MSRIADQSRRSQLRSPAAPKRALDSWELIVHPARGPGFSDFDCALPGFFGI
jgi:hypothetical protein